MKKIRSKILWLTNAGVALGLFATSAFARPPLLLAQGAPDCYAIGQQIAAEQGGTLAGASAETQGGSTVCRIVILVPAKDGERPRRVEVTVPAR
ncbi:hypothetical protein [Chelativorans sp. AA-79]|uniref:hypothetical protein n=1 Tax=Chelativorans sp. AA-79 TaxID=3028735 RepID=UPI0023F80CEA|nr:hypothetical protein [Chelativorans sp. AA-79]WEX07724.1 hypothetical protein PVE73_16640 [Chelativorans sp. AA-79]